MNVTKSPANTTSGGNGNRNKTAQQKIQQNNQTPPRKIKTNPHPANRSEKPNDNQN